MFDNHEELTCAGCGKVFMGRMPAPGGAMACPECLKSVELPVINEGEDIPDSVNEELEIGGGENG